MFSISAKIEKHMKNDPAGLGTSKYSGAFFKYKPSISLAISSASCQLKHNPHISKYVNLVKKAITFSDTSCFLDLHTKSLPPDLHRRLT